MAQKVIVRMRVYGGYFLQRWFSGVRTLFAMTEDAMFRICDRVREVSFDLHRYLRHGHVEKVYERGLVHRLGKTGLIANPQLPIPVRDEDGTMLGEFIADVVVENELLIEVKACRALAKEHVAQLLGYLRATGLEHGILVNFGAPKLEIRKFALSKII